MASCFVGLCHHEWWSVFALHAPFVLVTKFRHRIFTDAKEIIPPDGPASARFRADGSAARCTGARSTAVHRPRTRRRKVALSRLVNSLKGVSSRRMRQEFPEPARHYHRAGKLWSGSSAGRSPADGRGRPRR
ncbi:transposase [Nonomuraea sp. NPDC049421]|uniref:transposase n=1 Tax=Nonomuraea sp. NPDC049421 TaxID=3155275 RepID=UPI0034343B84